MDENGMENEHLDQKNPANCEYLPTKCRITKPPPPKPATNPLQFIKVAPSPLLQKAKEQVKQVEKIKKERKVSQDEAEDWQANLDNWKSSRRKLQEHIIERVVEVKKFEQDDGDRSRRRCKTFNEILEERGKSKYSIPIYTDESNDWSNYGISDSKSVNENSDKDIRDDPYLSDDYTQKKDEIVTSTDNISNLPKINNTQLNINNNYDTNEFGSKNSVDVTNNGQYTYEGAIEGYRSRIRSKFDETILVKISDMPKKTTEIESLVPKGEIVKRKQIFDRQQQNENNVPNMAARVLQDFENSISIKQRLKCLEQCTDQSVNSLVDNNLEIKPKVKEMSQMFAKNNQEEVSQSKPEFPQRRGKININIVPWRERESSQTSTNENSEFDQFNNDLKETESQSDDKSSDTFYSGLEDTNYPPSISSTDYMALSSDREDSGIHTADVSCSVSQADDTAEEVESNTNSHETANDDYQTRVKYIKDSEDNNNDVIQTSIESHESNFNHKHENVDEKRKSHLPEIKDGILKSDINKHFSDDPLLNAEPPIVDDAENLFNPDFTLLPTKLEPPKEKPPPPPISDDDKTSPSSDVERMNSTKRIKKEITMKRSNFLGLSEPRDNKDHWDGITIAIPKNEQSKVEEILAKQLYESKLDEYRDESVFEARKIIDESLGIKEKFQHKNSNTNEEDEIIKREREIIEMVEEAEKNRTDVNFEKDSTIIQSSKSPIPVSRTFPPTTANVQKLADASYYSKKPDCSDDQDAEVLKVEQELQQLEQEELKRKRDNMLFRQACSRVFAKNKRYSLENIFDAPTRSLECRISMPELQYDGQASPMQNGNFFRSIQEVDVTYRKSVPNIGYDRNDFQTIEKYERQSVPEFQHDMHRSAFEIPQRKSVYEHKQFIHPGEPIVHNKPNFSPKASDMLKPRNRNTLNAWLKTRPNVEVKSYDKHWLYQEAELRRLREQKNFPVWQQPKHLSEPNLVLRGPSTTSSMSSIRKLTSVGNDIQPYIEHHPLVGPPLPVPQPHSVAVEESQNRILSVSGKKKCSFCGNELGRGAAMIIETLYLFYHMDCFKCCVCHVQLGNGLNGTDVRVRNQKLHCHNCYSSDDGVKFSCV